MSMLKIGEFINLAIKDEDTGHAFYVELAHKTENQSLAKTYNKMAEQEKMHGDRFRRMLNDVGAFEPQERFAGEYEGYVDALLEMRAFTDIQKAIQKAKSLKNDREGMEIALKMEKDTLLFYFEILAFLPAGHKKYVEDIISEERQHVSALTELIKKTA